ncbi:LysR family transcriptional regulator [Mesobacterium sp. TK19101]|uniref:LysR family transcriptional regulator n=1 Tax=Mesobacterium hydrothermale TaxID=3111907 RepID=A0ABU6HF63_9RHOB|nr:LysR family transcriptional regulator [Mesobacterium sp. TK19101]MEC3861103.1 LysR family transcriptional regulator [Mesobacterium sp. TK19101]
MAIKIEMLRTFCAVARAGNLSDAAQHLGRTQSALSMTLKQLEAHLGGALFENERKNRLTPLGTQVLAMGLGQLRQFDSTVQAIEALARAPQGVLRIAAVPSVAAQTFPRLVRHLADAFPGLKIELRDSDTPQVIEALVQGWADIGIASALQPLKGAEAALLFRDRYGLVMAQDHPLAQQQDDPGIDAVFAVPFLGNALCARIETPRFRDRMAQADVTVHNTQSLLAMVRHGGWVTVLPQSVLRAAPEGVVFRPVDGLAEQREVYLYLREQPVSPGIASEARSFIVGLFPALGG